MLKKKLNTKIIKTSKGFLMDGYEIVKLDNGELRILLKLLNGESLNMTEKGEIAVLADYITIVLRRSTKEHN
jgi:hypothetical protein